MPFGQKFGSYLKTGFGIVKNFLGNAYTKTKDTLGSLDTMFGDIKKIYGTVAPAIQDLAPAQAQGGLVEHGGYGRVQSGITGFVSAGLDGFDRKIQAGGSAAVVVRGAWAQMFMATE